MESKFGAAFGCVMGIVVALFFVLWGASFFAPKPEAKTNPVVIDDAKVLTPDSISAIQSIRFRRDIPAIVRYRQHYPPPKRSEPTPPTRSVKSPRGKTCVHADFCANISPGPAVRSRSVRSRFP